MDIIDIHSCSVFNSNKFQKFAAPAFPGCIQVAWTNTIISLDLKWSCVQIQNFFLYLTYNLDNNEMRISGIY